MEIRLKLVTGEVVHVLTNGSEDVGLTVARLLAASHEAYIRYHMSHET